MARVKRGVTARHRHKKLLNLTKGFKHGRKNVYRLAKQALIKAKAYSYRDRKVKKRTFRSLWIVRINAAVRNQGLTYKEFIHGLTLSKMDLNRKVLAHLALEEPAAFDKLVQTAKDALKTK
jgi:large subunit ribosomal protein L20